MRRMFQSMDEENVSEHGWGECFRIWMRRMLQSIDEVNVKEYRWGEWLRVWMRRTFQSMDEGMFLSMDEDNVYEYR